MSTLPRAIPKDLTISFARIGFDDPQKRIGSLSLLFENIFTALCEQLGWKDSNLRMAVPKTAALPLGDTPDKLITNAIPFGYFFAIGKFTYLRFFSISMIEDVRDR